MPVSLVRTSNLLREATWPVGAIRNALAGRRFKGASGGGDTFSAKTGDM